jgi:uncharacterized protein YkwD
MRIFFVPSFKKYCLIGGGVFLFLGFIIRFLIPAFSLYELQLHTSIRTLLGFPLSFYSYTALIVLSVLYEFFYFLMGTVIGGYIFKLRNRHNGYTLLMTPRTMHILAVITLFAFYGYLRIDFFDRFHSNFSFPKRTKEYTIDLHSLQHFFMPEIAIPSQSGTAGDTPSMASQFLAPTDVPGGMTNSAPTPQQTSWNPPIAQPTSIPTVAPPYVPSSGELTQAINSYRQSHGSPSLAWESGLAAFAQAQAGYFDSKNGFVKDDGYSQIIYPLIPSINTFVTGEIDAIGVTGTATHIVVEVFGANPTQNSNQLNPKWTHVGIGVSGRTIIVVFGRHDNWHDE